MAPRADDSRTSLHLIFLILVHPLVEVSLDVRHLPRRLEQTRPVRARMRAAGSRARRDADVNESTPSQKHQNSGGRDGKKRDEKKPHDPHDACMCLSREKRPVDGRSGAIVVGLAPCAREDRAQLCTSASRIRASIADGKAGTSDRRRPQRAPRGDAERTSSDGPTGWCVSWRKKKKKQKPNARRFFPGRLLASSAFITMTTTFLEPTEILLSLALTRCRNCSSTA